MNVRSMESLFKWICGEVGIKDLVLVFKDEEYGVSYMGDMFKGYYHREGFDEDLMCYPKSVEDCCSGVATVYLYWRGMNRRTLCHEIAHHLTRTKPPRDCHRKVWRLRYNWLLKLIENK